MRRDFDYGIIFGAGLGRAHSAADRQSLDIRKWPFKKAKAS